MGLLGRVKGFSWAKEIPPPPEDVEITWLIEGEAYRYIDGDNYIVVEVADPPPDVAKKARLTFIDLLIENPDADLESLMIQATKRTLKLPKRLKTHDQLLATRMVLYYLRKHVVGLSNLQPVLYDPEIEDISFSPTGDDRIYVYIRGKWYKTNLRLSRGESVTIAFKLAERVGRQISMSSPRLEGPLHFETPSGRAAARVHALLNPDGGGGATFTLRKYVHRPPLSQLVRWRSLSPEMAGYIKLAVLHGLGGLIVGVTGSGKTTFLTALLNEIPPDRKIIIVEDTPEIELSRPRNFQKLIGKTSEKQRGTELTVQELIRDVLRMRPDYVVVGESRGEETKLLAQYMRLGATSLTTFHSSSLEEALGRLRAPPIEMDEEMIAEFTLMIQLGERVDRTGRKRRVTVEVAEIRVGDDGTVRLQTMYKFNGMDWDRVADPREGRAFARIAKKEGLTLDEIEEEMRRYVEEFSRALAGG